MFGKFFKNKSQMRKSAGKQSVSHDAVSHEPVSHKEVITSCSDNTSASDQTKAIEKTLKTYQSANFPQGIYKISSDLTIKVQNSKEIIIKLSMPFPCQGELDNLALALSEQLDTTVIFQISLNINSVRSFALKGSASNVKNIIAVSSGKGGVGKSTTTVNLAYALIAEGAKVGILDADIYGPSIPTLLGLKNAKPRSNDGKLLIPLEAHGLHAISIGFLVDERDATVWRGPMASGAFNQLLNETAWPELDYLLIDMPPGTGDIQLTLAQQVPVAATVIVTTPQDIALIDAAKGIAMYDKVQVPVLGIIENMSYHRCENCGHKSHIFGEAGGEQMAKSKDTQLLGQLPLDISIRQDADIGESAIIENSAGEIASLYRKIARNTAGQLFLQLDHTSPFTATIDYEPHTD